MPTPTAPPSTDSAASGMPAADSASSRPNSSNSARVALAAILRTDRLSPSAAISRASMAADSHSTSTNTMTADSAPSMRLRRVTSTPAMRQWMASNSAVTKGSKSVSQSTSTAHTSQETLRSSARTR